MHVAFEKPNDANVSPHKTALSFEFSMDLKSRKTNTKKNRCNLSMIEAKETQNFKQKLGFKPNRLSVVEVNRISGKSI